MTFSSGTPEFRCIKFILTPSRKEDKLVQEGIPCCLSNIIFTARRSPSHFCEHGAVLGNGAARGSKIVAGYGGIGAALEGRAAVVG